MDDDKTLVTSGEADEVVETLESGEVVDATLANPKDDVEAKLVEQKASFDALQLDLNKMKSSFQKRESKLADEWKTRESEYKLEAQKLKMASMNDDDRQVYERSLATERLAELESANTELRQAQENQRVQQESLTYFLGQGVALDSLTVDQGYDALIASGWKAINDEKESMKAELESLRQNPKGTPKEEAPEVMTGVTSTTPVNGPTWHDLIKKYGSMEHVYSLVESQQLDPSVIPA